MSHLLISCPHLFSLSHFLPPLLFFFTALDVHQSNAYLLSFSCFLSLSSFSNMMRPFKLAHARIKIGQAQMTSYQRLITCMLHVLVRCQTLKWWHTKDCWGNFNCVNLNILCQHSICVNKPPADLTMFASDKMYTTHVYYMYNNPLRTLPCLP